MTKLEMISEMLEELNSRQRESFTKRAMGKPKKIIEAIYEYFTTHQTKEGKIFVRTLLNS